MINVTKDGLVYSTTCKNMFSVDFSDKLVNASVLAFEEYALDKAKITFNDFCEDGRSTYSFFRILKNLRRKINFSFKSFDSTGKTLVDIVYHDAYVYDLPPLKGFDYRNATQDPFEIILCYDWMEDKTTCSQKDK